MSKVTVVAKSFIDVLVTFGHASQWEWKMGGWAIIRNVI